MSFDSCMCMRSFVGPHLLEAIWLNWAIVIGKRRDRTTWGEWSRRRSHRQEPEKERPEPRHSGREEPAQWLGQARPNNMAPVPLLATNIMEARRNSGGDSHCDALQDYGSQPTCEPMQDSILLAIADPATAAAGETHSQGRLWWQYPQGTRRRATAQCSSSSLGAVGGKSAYESLRRQARATQLWRRQHSCSGSCSTMPMWRVNSTSRASPASVSSFGTVAWRRRTSTWIASLR